MPRTDLAAEHRLDLVKVHARTPCFPFRSAKHHGLPTGLAQQFGHNYYPPYYRVVPNRYIIIPGIIIYDRTRVGPYRVPGYKVIIIVPYPGKAGVGLSFDGPVRH